MEDTSKIDELLKKWFVIRGSYEIDANGEINVEGDVLMQPIPASEPGTNRSPTANLPMGRSLPVKFGTVSGTFTVEATRIKSLAWCPRKVQTFVCNDHAGIDISEISGMTVDYEIQLKNCGLKNLKGVPSARIVDVNDNKEMMSLDGLVQGSSPVSVIYASGCSLSSLDGIPRTVRQLFINRGSQPIGSLRGLPSKMQRLHIDDSAPLCQLLETTWMIRKQVVANPRICQKEPGDTCSIGIDGNAEKIRNIAALFSELYPLGHDGIPAFAFDLIKMGYRSNARF